MKRRGCLKGLLASAVVAPALPAIVEAAPATAAIETVTSEVLVDGFISPQMVAEESLRRLMSDMQFSIAGVDERFTAESFNGNRITIDRPILASQRSGPD